MKTCTKCKILKLETEFNKRSDTKDGLAFWCRECLKQYHNKSYQDNRKQIIEKVKNYQMSHKKEVVEWKRKSYAIHKEEKLAKDKLNYIINKEQINLKKREYYRNHKKEAAIRSKIYRKSKPEEHKARRVWRKRNLGFHPLNDWFDGSVAHHVNINDVVYIPETIHKSVSHSLKTGRGMDTINKLAFVSCVMLTGQVVGG